MNKMVERKKSLKEIIPLDKIVRPYKIIPEEDLEGGVNSKMFFYPKGIPVNLEYPEWEVLFYAGKIKV